MAAVRPQVVKGTHTFNVRERYVLHEVVGQGAQGIICAAEDTLAPAGANAVAIKKVSNVFDDPMASKRLLREVQLLRHFNHDNILRLRVSALDARRILHQHRTSCSPYGTTRALSQPRRTPFVRAFARAGLEHRGNGHLYRYGADGLRPSFCDLVRAGAE